MPPGKYIRTPEIRQKQSDAMIGKYLGENNPNYGKDFSGENNPMFGKHHSDDAKQKMSENHADVSGENNPHFGKYGELASNWKGGITTLYDAIRRTGKYSMWRVNVLDRDLFICQACKKTSGGDMEVHHIKRFSIMINENNIRTIEQALLCEEFWDISNGITLCNDCHKLIHKEK